MNNTMLRLELAIALAKERGVDVNKMRLAARLWPESPEDSQRVSINRLIAGKVEKVKPEWIVIICEELQCTADFLLGIEEGL